MVLVLKQHSRINHPLLSCSAHTSQLAIGDFLNQIRTLLREILYSSKISGKRIAMQKTVLLKLKKRTSLRKIYIYFSINDLSKHVLTADGLRDFRDQFQMEM